MIHLSVVQASVQAPAIAPEYATQYTGDSLQGVPVIRQLNVQDLEPGKKHRFFFEGVQMGTGQPWLVPLVVAKGITDGKRIGLIAGVHGDELSSVNAVQQTMERLDPLQMAGVAIAVYDLCRPARELMQRGWPTLKDGGTAMDMNRVWPGDEDGGNPALRQAGILWNRLFQNNLDIALDYHTASTGAEYTLFIFADCRNPEIQEIATLFPAEQIKNDSGELGSLEMAFCEAGIPSITVEIGRPRGFDAPKIALTVEGSLNVLKHYGIIPGPIERTSKEANTFWGDEIETIRATVGGYLELQVDLNQEITSGQTVAIQRNAFGDVVAEYSASMAGRVAAIARDAVCEPGTRIIQILYPVPGLRVMT